MFARELKVEKKRMEEQESLNCVMMDPESILIEEDEVVESADDQNQLDLSSSYNENGTYYNIRSNEGVTYRVVHFNGIETVIPEDTKPVPQLVSNTTVLPAGTSQLYLIGNPETIYKGENKPRKSRVNRDDKRRATHNEIERRRRDKINTWIMKIGGILPIHNSKEDLDGTEPLSKGGVLGKAYDYINELKEENQSMFKTMAATNGTLDELKDKYEAIKRENVRLKNLLKENDVSF